MGKKKSNKLSIIVGVVIIFLFISGVMSNRTKPTNNKQQVKIETKKNVISKKEKIAANFNNLSDLKLTYSGNKRANAKIGSIIGAEYNQQGNNLFFDITTESVNYTVVEKYFNYAIRSVFPNTTEAELKIINKKLLTGQYKYYKPLNFKGTELLFNSQKLANGTYRYWFKMKIPLNTISFSEE